MTDDDRQALALIQQHRLCCPGCGYALMNLPEPKCPECGHHMSPATALEASREATGEADARRRSRLLILLGVSLAPAVMLALGWLSLNPRNAQTQGMSLLFFPPAAAGAMYYAMDTSTGLAARFFWVAFALLFLAFAFVALFI